jgi:hypothetical protein
LEEAVGYDDIVLKEKNYVRVDFRSIKVLQEYVKGIDKSVSIVDVFNSQRCPKALNSI